MADIDQFEASPQQHEGIALVVGGRTVVSQGVMVLGRRDSAAVIHLDNLQVNIAFVDDPGSLNADVQPVGETALRIRFTGTPDPFGASYELPNLVVWRGMWLHLTMMIHAIHDVATVRQVGFTITASEEAL